MRRSSQQSGYILLAMLLVFFVSGSSLMINVLNNRETTTLRAQEELHRQMALAKEALLAFVSNSALLYGDTIGPGYLPCPDTDNNTIPNLATESNAASTCPAANTLGRLPEYVPLISGKKFLLNDYYAGIDEQFWYAVSSRHLRTGTTTNSSSKTSAALSRLTLDSTSNIAALIIAPGPALSTQNRISNKTLYANYLDGTNGSSPSNYISTYAANPELFNDQVLAISHDEVMQAAGTGAARRIKQLLDAYHVTNGVYPPCINSCTQIPTDIIVQLNGGWLGTESWFAYAPPFTQVSGVWYLTMTASSTRYTRIDNDTVTLYFPGCANMVFTLSYTGGVSKPSGSSCL